MVGKGGRQICQTNKENCGNTGQFWKGTRTRTRFETLNHGQPGNNNNNNNICYNNNSNNNNRCLFPPFADFSELQVGSGKALTNIQLQI